MVYGEWECSNYRTFYGNIKMPLYLDNSDKEIVLIRGNNGFGKTTFINAIKLALYGSNAGLNKMITYDQYLKENINHKAKIEGNNTAWVSIKFLNNSKLTRSDIPKSIIVKREWTLVTDNEVEEFVYIYENGIELEIENDFEEYLSNIIPKEILNFFAFDTEEVRYTADDFNSGDNITSDISKILGITELEISKNELKIYESKQRKETINNCIDDKMIQSQMKIQKLKNNIKQNEYEIQGLIDENNKLDFTIENKIGWVEERGFLNNNKRKQTEEKIEKLLNQKNKIYNFYEDLKKDSFSYLLLIDEIRNLGNQFKKEEHYLIEKELQNNSSLIKDKLIVNLMQLKTTPKLTNTQLNNIENMIKSVWESLNNNNQNGWSVIHKNSLSKIEFDTLTEEINRILYTLEDEKSNISCKIESLDQIELEIKKENINIKKLPSNEQIEDIKIEINNLEQKKQDNIHRIGVLKERIHLDNKEIVDEEKLFQVLSRDLKEKNTALKKIELCNKVASILDLYTINLKKEKVKEIKTYLTDMYKSLANKKDMVKEFIIDERTFEISIIGRYGQPIAKRSLSEGEKQIYGLSLTYALAKASKKDLGFVIDTPFAKLDSIHKENVIKNFIPCIGKQVILLAQDEELTGDSLKKIREYSTQEYELKNDIENSTTYEVVQEVEIA